MCGAVIAMSCPLLAGLVRTSWYPVMPVAQTTSPLTVPVAANETPSNARPSPSTTMAEIILAPPAEFRPKRWPCPARTWARHGPDAPYPCRDDYGTARGSRGPELWEAQ